MTIATREFKDYDEYVYKQGGKARGMRDDLLRDLPRHIRGFTKTFREAAPYLPSGPVLCLGARTGGEVQGATEAGFLGSVGIDLHPVVPTVLHGDWHALQFADGSFVNVYCNSLDHCLYLDRMAKEVRRVLAPGGRFYVMATNRDKTEDEWRAKGSNEALYWQTSDDLCAAICEFGFVSMMSWRTGKWGHYILAVAQ